MTICYVAPNPQLSPHNTALLEKHGKVILVKGKHPSTKEFIELVSDADILITTPSVGIQFDKTIFAHTPKLKHIALLSSGYDCINSIDADTYAISISRCAGANAHAVAEHTWGMILGLSKRIVEQHCDLLKNSNSHATTFQGTELFGKTLGVIGTGAIGSLVGAVGQSIGMNVIGCNRRMKQVASFKSIVTLNTLLRESDVISLHLPLTAETKHLINQDTLTQTKSGVIIVNTAREAIVEHAALCKMLRSKHVLGYGLDANSFTKKTKDLLSFSSTIVTIHNAYNTAEAKQASEDQAVQNILAYLKNTVTSQIV